MSAAEKEARIAHAKWQEARLVIAALTDAMDRAIDELDGRNPMVGVDLLACNTAARKRLDEARKAARK